MAELQGHGAGWGNIVKNRNCYRKQEVVAGYVLSLPFFLLFCLFTVVPVLGSFLISFTSFDMLQVPRFVWIENYVRLFLKDDIFIRAISNTFLLALIIGPFGYILSFFFAWLLNEVDTGLRSVLTLCFYAPSISGNMIVVWQYFFSGDSQGYLNSVLYNLGLSNTPVIWLKNPETILPIVCLVSLWGSLGTSFLVFIAGLQGVERAYYEAAAIDGLRNRWQELWYITLPLMKPQLLFSAVMSITGSFGVGGLITQLCGYPTVNYAAHTIMNHMQDYAGMRFEAGYASAIATILFGLMIFCNKLVQRLLRKVGS